MDTVSVDNFLNNKLITTPRFGPGSSKVETFDVKKVQLEEDHKQLLSDADKQTRKNLNVSSQKEFLKNKKIILELLNSIIHQNIDIIHSLEYKLNENNIHKMELQKLSDELTNLDKDSELIKNDDSLLRDAVFTLERIRRSSIHIQNESNKSNSYTDTFSRDKSSSTVTDNPLKSLTFGQITKIGLYSLWPLIIAVVASSILIAFSIIYSFK